MGQIHLTTLLALASEAYRKGPVLLPRKRRMIAVGVFSGLVSSACARASAAAIAPIRSLDWCIGGLHLR